MVDPWNERQPHYDVILTAQDLYTLFRGMDDKRMERETKKQELFHEVGHVFGLPNVRRGSDLEYSLGAHCTNKCAIRQGLYVPRDWINFVRDREETGQVYCDPCIKDLRAYFGKQFPSRSQK